MELIQLQNQIKIFENAYKTLEEAFSQSQLSELEKDGVIQRFEYNIELSWKTLKNVLIYEKIDFIFSPREVIKESFKLWFISSIEVWEQHLDVRNQMTHTYSAYHSKNNFLYIEKNYKSIRILLKCLQSKYL